VAAIYHYVTASGNDPFQSWLEGLQDKATAARIAARLERLIAGNFGDCKSLGGSLYELRVDYGPGYRVYYTMIGKEIVLLLCAGDKSRQTGDIATARTYLKDYRKRSGRHEN
jgi:putative addiction module killer protein